jgi:hypothetical protein
MLDAVLRDMYVIGAVLKDTESLVKVVNVFFYSFTCMTMASTLSPSAVPGLC